MPKLEGLEGLRGICALAVLACHLIYGTDQQAGGFGLLPMLGSFAHLAVLIFFVLSGFVIGYTTPSEFTFSRAKIYLTKRLIRLYPIYLLCVIFSWLISSNRFDLHILFGHLFFMQGWIVPLMETNGPLWSLHYEFLFYLLFLIIWGFKIKIYKAIIICLFSSLMTFFWDLHFLEIIAYFTLWLIGLWIAKNRENLPKLDAKYKLTEPNHFWSSIAIVVAFGWANVSEIIINTYGVKHNGFMPILPPVLSDVLISVVVAAIVASTLGYRLPNYKSFFYLAVANVAFALGFSILKATFISIFRYQMAAFFLALIPLTFILKNIPRKFLEKLSFLGSISYALYIFHSPIQGVIYKLPIWGKEGVHNWLPNFWQANLLVLSLSISIAFVLERLIQPKIAAKLKILAGII